MILNSTMNSTEDSSESIPIFNVVVCVFNIPLSLASIVANAVILVAISKTSAFHSPSTILLSNLALTSIGWTACSAIVHCEHSGKVEG